MNRFNGALPGAFFADRRALRVLCLLWLIGLAALTIAPISSHALLEPDEGRNAEVAREMLASGNYLVPHLNGLPYADKPFLYFATVAASMRSFGLTEVAARLPSTLFTALTALLVGWFGRSRWGTEAGLTAAIATLAAPLPFMLSRIVILDAMFTFLMAAALLSFFLAVEHRAEATSGQVNGTAHWKLWCMVAWAAIGLGVLTKGPVALLLPLIVAIPYAVYRKAGRAVAFPAALLICALIVAPWVWSMAQKVPDYIHYVLVTETWSRLTSDELNRPGPIWYFVPVLLAGAFPWICMLVPSAWRAVRARIRPDDPTIIFLLLWLLLPFLFFSLARSKLPHYMLPLVPAVALLIAAALRRPGETALPGAIASIGWLIVGALLVVSAALPEGVTDIDASIAAEARAFVTLIGIVAVLAGVVCWILRKQAAGLVMTCSLPLVAVLLASEPLLHKVADMRSSRTLATAIRAHLPENGQVVGVGVLPISLPFYLRMPVVLSSNTGLETTSNYIAAEYVRLTNDQRSSIRAGAWWLEAARNCDVPYVFVIANKDQATLELAATQLALITAGRKYSALGPCVPKSGARILETRN